jgi:hypothetical protein
MPLSSNAVDRQIRVAAANRLIVAGASLDEAAAQLGYADGANLRRAMGVRSGRVVAPPSRPPHLAEDYAAVSAEAAALEAAAQQALWACKDHVGYLELMLRADKAYVEKRRLYALRAAGGAEKVLSTPTDSGRGWAWVVN